MAKGTIISGTSMMVWINTSTSASPKYEVIAHAQSAELTLDMDTVDVSSKDTGSWKDFIAGSKSWSISSDHTLSTDTNGFSLLFDKYITGEYVKVKIGIAKEAAEDGVPDAGWTQDTTSGNIALEGEAMVTALPLSMPNGASATFKMTLTGKGKIVKTSTL